MSPPSNALFYLFLLVGISLLSMRTTTSVLQGFELSLGVTNEEEAAADEYAQHRVLQLKDEDDDDDDDDDRPHNLHLAIIGDSVARYQYIDLVYYLQTGKWIANTTDKVSTTGWGQGNPNLLFKKTYKSWNDYLDASHAALRPGERICDCGDWGPRFYMATYSENRYYRDDSRNNVVTFLNKYGSRPVQGYYHPEDVYRSDHAETIPTNRTVHHPFLWKGNWSYAIREHLAKLDPPPKYVLFNAGLHPHNLPHDAPDIQKALDDTGMIGVYKTTTYPNTNNKKTRRCNRCHHGGLCGKVFRNCLDYSWTADFEGSEHYFDDNHLKPHMNHRMNRELLALWNRLEGNTQDDIERTASKA